MRIHTLSATTVGAVLSIALGTLPVNAQASRTWVSSGGDDAFACSRVSPCKTFAGAIVNTAPGGEINCVDNGAFGAVTVTKAITILCDTNQAGVLAPAGITGVTIIAGASDVVTLVGLDINGIGIGSNGIRFLSGAALHVLKSKIHGFRAAGANGISFVPSSGTSELYVSDNFIADNGTSTTTGGIVIAPTSTASVRASINRNQIENNTVGLRVSGTANSGDIRVLAADNVIVGNTNNGVLSSASTAFTSVFLDHNRIFANNVGVQSDGANSLMQIAGNTITSNLGAGMSPTAGGQLQSYLSNNINFNSGGDGVTAGANLTQK